MSYDEYKQIMINQTGLVGCWFFDQLGAGKLHDYSGKGNHGTINGATWRGNRGAGALSFDGTDDKIDTLYKTNGGNYTVSAWVNPASETNPSSGSSLIITGETNTTSSSYGIYFIYLSQAFYFGHFKSISGQYDLVQTAADYPIDTWYHVTAVRKNNDYHKIFVNGVEKATGSCADVTNTSTNNLRIGDDYYQLARNFNGLIDEVHIYNRALRADEIKKNYELGKEFHND